MSSAVATLFIVIFGAIIWLSVTAKPLAPGPDQKPYRWATFLALTTGLFTLVFVPNIPKAVQTGNTLAAVLFTALALLCMGTCRELMRRKRSGVPLFLLTYSLIFVAPILLNSASGTPMNMNAQDEMQLSAFFIYFLISAHYLCKRWRLFKMRTSRRRASSFRTASRNPKHERKRQGSIVLSKWGGTLRVDNPATFEIRK